VEWIESVLKAIGNPYLVVITVLALAAMFFSFRLLHAGLRCMMEHQRAIEQERNQVDRDMAASIREIAQTSCKNAIVLEELHRHQQIVDQRFIEPIQPGGGKK
jgi:hypothetical protein